MQFQNPTFLFALLTIAIPILIHIFNFKRFKTVYFSNVAFLKDIKKESQKKSRLKQLLILATRILAISALVFVFAGPFIPNPGSNASSKHIVGVYVDNSFSMSALSSDGQLLESAKAKALQLAEAYPEGTLFRLFTNDLNPIHQHLLHKEQLIKELSAIKLSPSRINLSTIYKRFADLTQSDTSPHSYSLYLLSDFQRSSTDLVHFSKPENFSLFSIPLRPNKQGNLYIDSCWIETPAHRPGAEEELFVKIKNNSQQAYRELPLKLLINDSTKAIINFSIESNSELITSLKYTNGHPGIQRGKLEISDYPFTFDNNWYFSYEIRQQLKAVAIYDNSEESQQGLKALKTLFDNDNYINLAEMPVKQLRINELKQFNSLFLINLTHYPEVLINQLRELDKQGLSIIVAPSLSTPIHEQNKLLRTFNIQSVTHIDSTPQKISLIDFEHPLYKTAFAKKEENPVLPVINGHLVFNPASYSKMQQVLAFPNGDAALSELLTGNGKFYVFSFPLCKVNQSFLHDILFVPTLYNIVLNSFPRQNLSYTVGASTFYHLQAFQVPNLTNPIELLHLATNTTIVPNRTITGLGIHLDFSGLIQNDGHYNIRNDNTTITTLAFNYDRAESDLRYFAPEELKNILDQNQIKNAEIVSDTKQKFEQIIDELHKDRSLRIWFLLAALLFILAEIIIIRFMK